LIRHGSQGIDRRAPTNNGTGVGRVDFDRFEQAVHRSASIRSFIITQPEGLPGDPQWNQSEVPVAGRGSLQCIDPSCCKARPILVGCINRIFLDLTAGRPEVNEFPVSLQCFCVVFHPDIAGCHIAIPFFGRIDRIWKVRITLSRGEFPDGFGVPLLLESRIPDR